MLIIDIPFAPDRGAHWTIAIGRESRRVFTTRKDAVQFAAGEAERIQRIEHRSVVINIEGADGLWRPFRTSLESIT
jgi:Uncharacterized protein conserved in bacteria (DUF2188)